MICLKLLQRSSIIPVTVLNFTFELNYSSSLMIKIKNAMDNALLRHSGPSIPWYEYQVGELDFIGGSWKKY